MRDSYSRFFKHFKIQIDELITFGIKDTIFPNPKKIEPIWDQLKKNILNDNEVFIRGFGRDAWGTFLFQEFYKITLNNNNIKKDSTNNNEPTTLLQKITGYHKTTNNANISNYQVSHIFGKTKNPLMFTAPWNIVWNPKILDPFTGHESKGNYKNRYNTIFIKTAKIKYYSYIIEYNEFVEKYFNQNQIEFAINQLEEQKTDKRITDKKFNRFKKQVYQELSQIDIKDINKDLEIISAFLIDGKSHRWIQKNILNIEAPSRGGGFEAMNILHHWKIDNKQKGILKNNQIEAEIKNSKDTYKEILMALKKYLDLK